MIGVILWSDQTDRKAVIWCEDQGDLAFLDNAVHAADPTRFFDVGDIVRFDLCVQANLRRAHNAALLADHQTESDASPAQMLPNTIQSAKIIPFRVASKATDREEKRNAQGA